MKKIILPTNCKSFRNHKSVKRLAKMIFFHTVQRMFELKLAVKSLFQLMFCFSRENAQTNYHKPNDTVLLSCVLLLSTSCSVFCFTPVFSCSSPG